MLYYNQLYYIIPL